MQIIIFFFIIGTINFPLHSKRYKKKEIKKKRKQRETMDKFTIINQEKYYLIRKEYLFIVILCLLKLIYDKYSIDNISWNNPNNSLIIQGNSLPDVKYSSYLIKNFLSLIKIKIDDNLKNTETIFWQHIFEQKSLKSKKKILLPIDKTNFILETIMIFNELPNDIKNNFIFNIINNFYQLYHFQKIFLTEKKQKVILNNNIINNILLSLFSIENLYDFFEKLIDEFVEIKKIKKPDGFTTQQLTNLLSVAINDNEKRKKLIDPLDKIVKFLNLNDNINDFINFVINKFTVEIISILKENYKNFISNNKKILHQWPTEENLKIIIENFIEGLISASIISKDFIETNPDVKKLLQLYLKKAQLILQIIDDIALFFDQQELKTILEILDN